MTYSNIYSDSEKLFYQSPFFPSMEGIVVVHNDIIVVMLSILCIFILMFFYLIYKEAISNKNSNILNAVNHRINGSRSSGSFPSGSPRPPKKNWKEKLKEHLSNYKEIYIGAGITLGLIILYYYYGQGSVPPSAGSELVPPSVGPIGPESIPSNVGPIGPESTNNYSIGPIGPEASHINTIAPVDNSEIETRMIPSSNILSFSTSQRVDFTNYVDYSFIYKYFIINLIGPLTLVKAALSSYIISNNYIDYSLLYMNKLHGSVGAMSFIIQLNEINRLSELNSINYNLGQFDYSLEQLENVLKLFMEHHANFIIVDQFFTFEMYQKYINELIEISLSFNLNENNDLFGIYFNSVFYPIPQNYEESLTIFYQDLNRKMVQTLKQGFIPDDDEVLKFINYITLKLIFNPDNYVDIPKLHLKTVDDLRLLKHHFLFQSLKLYIINFDLHDFEDNEFQFNLVFNFYLKLLKYYKLPPLSFLEFFCFLESIDLEDKISNLSEHIESTRSTIPSYREFYDI